MSAIFSQKVIKNLQEAAEHADNLAAAVLEYAPKWGTMDPDELEKSLKELFDEMTVLRALCSLNGWEWTDVVTAVDARGIAAIEAKQATKQ